MQLHAREVEQSPLRGASLSRSLRNNDSFQKIRCAAPPKCLTFDTVYGSTQALAKHHANRDPLQIVIQKSFHLEVGILKNIVLVAETKVS